MKNEIFRLLKYESLYQNPSIVFVSNVTLVEDSEHFIDFFENLFRIKCKNIRGFQLPFHFCKYLYNSES